MNLLAAFKQQCQHSPEQLAFIEGSRQLNYAEFQHAVNQLAAFLQQQNGNDKPIALFLERGIDAAIALYAVLTLGASYLPLDIKNPIQRLNFIIEDAKPQLILGKGNRPKNLTEKFTWLDLDELSLSSVAVETITIKAESIAAILYTSGSTGTPKGVALSHQAMLNFSSWAAKTFTLNHHDRVASLAPFHFDLSVFDLFTSLATGASVIFVPARLTLSPSRLTAWLSEMHISIFYTVPSLLSFMALKGNLAKTQLNTLKQILFAGEVFPTEPLLKLTELLPHVSFYNLYGPTETNVCCYWKVDRKRLQINQTIPIGIAAADSQLSISEQGELCVKSLNNFSGYWQQGQLTRRKLEDAYPTGDKVSRNQQGEYCYHGRLDRMLKCSGYRVEPAEIEAALNKITGVSVCAVIGITDSSSGQRPAAVLVLQENTELMTIVKHLKQNLPTYMQPVKFKTVDALPTLSNGKADYPALSRLF